MISTLDPGLQWCQKTSTAAQGQFPIEAMHDQDSSGVSSDRSWLCLSCGDGLSKDWHLTDLFADYIAKIRNLRVRHWHDGTECTSGP